MISDFDVTDSKLTSPGRSGGRRVAVWADSAPNCEHWCQSRAIGRHRRRFSAEVVPMAFAARRSRLEAHGEESPRKFGAARFLLDLQPAIEETKESIFSLVLD